MNSEDFFRSNSSGAILRPRYQQKTGGTAWCGFARQVVWGRVIRDEDGPYPISVPCFVVNILYRFTALIITGRPLDLAARILMNCNGLLVRAFNENSSVVADH